jgi:hypothetical protein
MGKWIPSTVDGWEFLLPMEVELCVAVSVAHNGEGEERRTKKDLVQCVHNSLFKLIVVN